MPDPGRSDVERWRVKLHPGSSEQGTREVAMAHLLLDLIDEERVARGARLVDRDQFFLDVNALTLRIDNA